MNRFAALALAGLTALSLVACQKEDAAGESPAATAQATSTPDAAITEIAGKLKSGDILAVMQMSLPPKHVDKIKADWKAKMASDPVTEEDRAEFAEMVAKLTAADAEAALYAEAEPQLAKMETEMAAQMPMLIGMGQGFAMQSIQGNEKLSEAQKKQFADVVGATATWLQGVKFADRELAKQAIAKAVATARALELTTLDEMRGLEFEPAMAKAGIAFNGVKDVLAVYGLNLNQSFDSVKTQVLSQEGDKAKVKVDYTIFGQPLSYEAEMVQLDGRWYGQDTIEQIEKELSAPAEVAAPADAEPVDGEAEEAAEVAPQG